MSTSGPASSASSPVDAVSPRSSDAPGLGPVSERVAEAVLAHPGVAGLSSGPYGTVVTYEPGRRLAGIAMGTGDEPTRVSVVLHWGAPVRATADALRQLVADLTGARQVDVVVTDLARPGETVTDVPSRGGGT